MRPRSRRRLLAQGFNVAFDGGQAVCVRLDRVLCVLLDVLQLRQEPARRVDLTLSQHHPVAGGVGEAERLCGVCTADRDGVQRDRAAVDLELARVALGVVIRPQPTQVGQRRLDLATDPLDHIAAIIERVAIDLHRPRILAVVALENVLAHRIADRFELGGLLL